MTFEDAKDTIIQRSINSAVYIDDEVSEPYSGDGEEIIKSTRSLYQSFREKGPCDLDIYKYRTLEEFRNNMDWLLNHKNLLILDWELNQDVEVKFEDALEILSNVVDKHRVNFIVIYTKMADSVSIIQQIKCAFSGLENLYESLKNDLSRIVENGCTDSSTDEIWAQIVSFYKNNYQKSSIDQKELLRVLLAKEMIECGKDIVPLGRKYNKKVDELIPYLEVAALATYKHQYNQILCEIIGDDVFLLDGIPVFIIQKNGDIAPDTLYNHIKTKIGNIPNNRSMLLSLYFRNSVLQQVPKVGLGLNHISDATLINFVSRHKEKEENGQIIPENKPALHSFVQECIMGDFFTLLSNNTDDFLSSLLWDDNALEQCNLEDAIKLNSFLSFIPEERLRNEQRQISTGDIFEKLENGKHKGYLMCITQGCDCVRPKKIDFNYAFSTGFAITEDSVLAGAEERYCTYMPDGHLCIEWTRKFYTIHLENTQQRIFDTQAPIKIDATTSLRYLGTQKDHYAQRVINNVFSTAMRIGADLVTHEKEVKPDCEFYKTDKCHYTDNEAVEVTKKIDAKVPVKNMR